MYMMLSSFWIILLIVIDIVVYTVQIGCRASAFLNEMEHPKSYMVFLTKTWVNSIENLSE